SNPPMISDELRRQADNFIELDELRDVIGRPPRDVDVSQDAVEEQVD
ncbi:MAG: NYN domain-containing protein, partial [Myxococcota bacterium]